MSATETNAQLRGPALNEGHLQPTLALLANTPAVLNALLHDLSEGMTQCNEGPDAHGKPSWNVFEVIGHLVFTELVNWMPRVHFLLANGEAAMFPPPVNERHHDRIAALSLAGRLEDFAHLRAESLTALRTLNLQPSDLERRGVHAAFGPVTLAQLLATWATHDLTHLHQISRILAYQNRESVGPWIAYLGVLHCEGHGSF